MDTSRSASATPRLFLAVELTDTIRSQAASLSGRLQKAAHFTSLRATWVPPENLHLTLFFLGDVPAAQAQRLCRTMTDAAAAVPPFKLDFRKLGVFPPDGPKPPRVLWIGVHRPPEELIRLRRACSLAIQRAGLPVPDQDFTPHLTLARFRSTKGLGPFRQQLRTYEHAKIGTCGVHRLLLMESITGGGPARYTPYAAAGLGAPNKTLHTDVAYESGQPEDDS